MWTNQMLKQNAWTTLKPYYWTAFGVTLVASLLGGNSNFGGFSGGAMNREDSEKLEQITGNMSPAFLIGVLVGVIVVWVIAMAIALAIYAFLGGIVKCGECKFYCKGRTGDVNFGYLFDNFQGGRYMPTVKTMFQMQLEITLWSLLFIIPGIIKAYEYALVPYIIAENPFMDKKRALEISKQTMEGEKIKLFILGLSFIGWYLLGALACGVGVLFVAPYFEATMAEFYTCMRAKMLANGITTEDELTGTSGGFGGYGGGYPQNFSNNAYQNPYQNQNPYDTSQNPYQNQNPYGTPQSPYQNQNPYDTPQNPYQNNGGVNLNKNPYDDNNNNPY